MPYEQQPDLMRRASSKSLQAKTADWMRNLLTSASFTEEQLSAAFGIDAQTVRDWCAGIAEPPGDVVQAFQRLAEIHQSLS